MWVCPNALGPYGSPFFWSFLALCDGCSSSLWIPDKVGLTSSSRLKQQLNRRSAVKNGWSHCWRWSCRVGAEAMSPLSTSTEYYEYYGPTRSRSSKRLDRGGGTGYPITWHYFQRYIRAAVSLWKCGKAELTDYSMSYSLSVSFL
jgi:hypothetical protein